MSNRNLQERELSGITPPPEAPTVAPKGFSLSSISRLRAGHFSENITYGPATKQEYTIFVRELLRPGGVLHHLENTLRFHYDPDMLLTSFISKA